MLRKKNEKTSKTQQFTLSKKTIALVNWLIEHDQESLKKLLSKAYQNGALRMDHDEFFDEEDAQYVFFKLVGLVEILSEEVVEEQEVSHVFHRSLLPVIKQIDSKEFEQTTIENSANKALCNAKERNVTPSSILFEELLKKWKPQKKQIQ